MTEPPPAEFEISRTDPDGAISDIYACGQHLARTIQIMLQDGAAVTVAIRPADPAVHGCKGHFEDWPVP